MTNQITEYSPIEATLAELKESYAGVLYDCKVPAEMKDAKAAKSSLVKIRTGLEKIRVEIKAPALSHCQSIDSEARRITSEIQAIENLIADQIKKEENRKADIKAAKEAKDAAALLEWKNKIEAIKRRPLDYISSSPALILAAIEKARALTVDSFPEELQPEARVALSEAISKLEEMHIAALDRVELEARAAAAPSPAPIAESELLLIDDPVKPAVTSRVPGLANSNPFVDTPVEAGEKKFDALTSQIDTEIDKINEESNSGELKILSPAFSAKYDTWQNLLETAKAVCAHYGKFKNVHPTIVELISAISDAESV